MKLTNINTILLYISLVLAIAILFSVIFGCFFKKRKIEKFATDSNDADKTLDTSKKNNDNKDGKKESKKEGAGFATASKLSNFESSIVDGLSSGKMSSKDLEKFIQDGKFTKENLNNMISFIEEKQKKS